MSHRIAFLGVLGCLLLFCPVARGQDLPPAKDIMEKYIQVTGGRDAHLKIRNVKSEGTFDLAAQGIKGTMRTWQEGNKNYAEVELPNIGKFVEATDGKNAWELNLVTGNRLKEGQELENALFEADFNGDVNWEKRYKKVEVVGVENVDGKPAYKVVCTPEKAFPRTNYYDKESGLLVKTETKTVTPMGEFAAEARVSDYRDVGGIKHPFKTVLKVNDNEVTIATEKVETNVEMPKDRFEMPKEIKDLKK